MSLGNLKNNFTSKFSAPFFFRCSASTFKIPYLQRKNKHVQNPIIYLPYQKMNSIQHHCNVIFNPAPSRINQVLCWTSSAKCEKDFLLMAWPWPFVLSWLSKKAIFFFCLLREICFLTLLYMLKALFLDEHNTSSNVTCTNNHFQQLCNFML